MRASRPTVSIGLPVHNGERHLGETLESLLRQDFTDFELIISDNASTDATPDICADYARRDSRIRYSRCSSNIGAAANYNRLVGMAGGRYFKWAPHDDLYDPACLGECVRELEQDARAVLAYPVAMVMDEQGTVLRRHEDYHDVRGDDPADRFRQLLADSNSWCNSVLGVMRLNVLRRTQLVGLYGGADHVLLAELVFRGEFHEIPRPLFFRRVHDGVSPSLRANATPEDIASWFDPRRSRRAVMLRTQLLIEHLRAISRAPLTGQQKWVCCRLLWTTPFAENWAASLLLGELRRALRRMTWDRHLLDSIHRARRQYLPHRLWAALSGLKHGEARRVLLAVSPPGERTHAELLRFVASNLSQRSDRESLAILEDWLTGKREAHRLAAAEALPRRQAPDHAKA